MRPYLIAASLLLAADLPASSQDLNSTPPSAEQERDAPSDAQQAQRKAQIEAGRKKQEAANAKTMGLWTRWTYAICIGCGAGEPKNIRVVHTTPARVLIGVPAAEDDARELAMAKRKRQRRLV